MILSGLIAFETAPGRHVLMEHRRGFIPEFRPSTPHFPIGEIYQDEMKTADGGIAINAWDLSRFIEGIWKGEILSTESRAAMMDFFELPDDWKGDVLGEDQNGFGIEVFQTSRGLAIGHTGAVDGFLSILLYFPDTDRTFISFVNAASFNSEAREKMFIETLEVMFE